MRRSDESVGKTVLKARCDTMILVGRRERIPERMRGVGVGLEMPTYEELSPMELREHLGQLRGDEESTWNVNMADPVALHGLDHSGRSAQGRVRALVFLLPNGRPTPLHS